MSVESPEVQDFEQVTPVVAPNKAKPAKKATTASRPAPRPSPKSEAEVRAEVRASLEQEAEMRRRIEEELRAEIEADLRAELSSRKVDASTEDIEETPYPHITPGPGEKVIHTVEDGLTVGNRVYVRGEELALNPQDHPWIEFGRSKQIKIYGKQLFVQGPWPYGGYDLTDPELTPEDKRRLIDVTSDSDFG